MRIPLPILRRILIAAPLVLGLLLALHWRPGRQVRLHQEHFLRAVEDRNWAKVGDFVAPDYRDHWQQDRKQLLENLPPVFGDFLACGILERDVTLAWKDGAGMIASRLEVVGSGGPIAQAVIDRTAGLKQPFALIWRRQSWKPWTWKLVSAGQPELDGGF